MSETRVPHQGYQGHAFVVIVFITSMHPRGITVKNRQLMHMYKVYSAIIIISALIIIILTLFFSINIIKQEKNKNISDFIQDVYTRKDSFEKGMALMFHHVYLQRSRIEDCLSNCHSDRAMNGWMEKIQYDKDMNISSMDAYQRENTSEQGNIIIYGDISDMGVSRVNEIHRMQDIFQFQKYISRSSMFDIWSVYYSKSGYLTIYPFSYAGEIVQDGDSIFNAISTSIANLNQLQDESILLDGWNTDIFWDNTETELIFSKNLPVIRDGVIEGIVTSNISIKDVQENINMQNDEEIYIIDSSGQVVYDSHHSVYDIKILSEQLEKRYPKKKLQEGIDAEGVHKLDNDYMISTKLDNVQWKMIFIIPGKLIEHSFTERIFIVALICIFVLFGAFLSLRLLKKYCEKYQRIDDLKTEFLMMVSHDLKAPLSNIMGFTGLISRKFQNEIIPSIKSPTQKSQETVDKIQRNLKIIEKESKRLSEMVDDLLDLSKLESGEAGLYQESINLFELCQEVYGITHAAADEKNIEYTVQIEPGLQDIIADKQKIVQVLVNLVVNAIKFTDAGSIALQVKREEEQVLFSVKDTGGGIPKEMQDKIFNKFERGKYQANKRVHGSGVGLAICKNIVEMHGGEIWVDSKANKGSTFLFSIPVVGKKEESDCV